MDNTEAKLILSAYRSQGQEAQDPHFAAALEQARLDPDLGAWFAEQQKFDRAISEKLGGCPVPQSLKSTILAGTQTQVSPRSWRQVMPWALAAMLILGLGLGFWFQQTPQQPSWADYREEVGAKAVALIENGFELEYQSSDRTSVMDWIRKRQLVGHVSLTQGMTESRPLGCKALEWRGHQLALVCFKSDQNQVAHLSF
ncbi:MAG: DUF3379 domain-containing protein [Blastochloris sp.]|nr:DUF3379 domain-containing protein [Blastochloris sp.]